MGRGKLQSLCGDRPDVRGRKYEPQCPPRPAQHADLGFPWRSRYDRSTRTEPGDDRGAEEDRQHRSEIHRIPRRRPRLLGTALWHARTVRLVPATQALRSPGPSASRQWWPSKGDEPISSRLILSRCAKSAKGPRTPRKNAKLNFLALLVSWRPWR